jgi:uncharacterized protein YbjT (DUF2867 family)
MRLLLLGCSGFVGRELVPFLLELGHEVTLVSRQAQTVQLAGETWSFAAGEPLITEYSVKYTPEAFLALAASAGWRGAGRWSDPGSDLSLHLLVTADS